MDKKGYSIILAIWLLSGCAPMSQNADEFRKLVGTDAAGTVYETFEVNQPYSKIAATLKAKAKECLDTKVAITTCSSGKGCWTHDEVYTPTIVSGPNKTELHLQWRMVPEKLMNFAGGKPPANGLYVAVADATPAGNGKTKMNVYYAGQVATSGTVPEAIKHWANGTNMGCPNLAKER